MYILLILIILIFLSYFIYKVIKKRRLRKERDIFKNNVQTKHNLENKVLDISIESDSNPLVNTENEISWKTKPMVAKDVFKNDLNEIDFGIKIKSTPKSQLKINDSQNKNIALKEITKNTIYTKHTKFTLFDVETANDSRSSICQIAYIVIEDNKIVKSESHLVKPVPNLFDTFNVSIHGITKNMVKGQKTFTELWPLISENFSDDHLVIAHNAGFDISCLRSLSEKYNLNIKNFSYLCSRYSLAKVDSTLEKHSLEYLSNKFNLKFNHHDALDDTKIIISIINQYSNSVSEFVELAISKGYKLKKFNK